MSAKGSRRRVPYSLAGSLSNQRRVRNNQTTIRTIRIRPMMWMCMTTPLRQWMVNAARQAVSPSRRCRASLDGPCQGLPSRSRGRDGDCAQARVEGVRAEAVGVVHLNRARITAMTTHTGRAIRLSVSNHIAVRKGSPLNTTNPTTMTVAMSIALPMTIFLCLYNVSHTYLW